MNMDNVKQLMQEAEVGFLATTDGKRASVRPMGGATWVDEELWFASFKDTVKVGNLEDHPQAEVCYMTRDYRHARIAGPCRVSTDQADKDKLYGLLPVLQRYIDSSADPGYVVLRLKPASVRIMASGEMKYEKVL